MVLRVQETVDPDVEDAVISPALRSCIEMEETAASISTFSFSMLNGRLQTEAYARALVSILPHRYSETTTEAIVALRMRRQWRTFERLDPPRLPCVIDEALLHRPVGGVEVLREQLLHLAEIAELAHICVQVFPFAPARGLTSYPGIDFDIIRPRDSGRATLLFVENCLSERSSVNAHEVHEFRGLFHRLREYALSPEDSIAMIMRSARALEGR